MLTYLKLGGWKLGLPINFNVPVLKAFAGGSFNAAFLSVTSVSPLCLCGDSPLELEAQLSLKVPDLIALR